MNKNLSKEEEGEEEERNTALKSTPIRSLVF